MSLLFIDVDRFKSINDSLGHEAGDRVLREVAGFIVRNVRGADYVFRWGGDEFLVLLSCAEGQARARGEALQRAFNGSAESRSLPAGVGLSIGCTEVPLDTDDVLAQVRIADERMYRAKHSTRG
jgi:diguanylate cyclase (GGDEF)-like protein